MPEPGHGTELFELLRSMALPTGHYAVFGSGPLLARGIIESVSDLDVICRGPAWSRACELGPLVDLDEEGVQIVSAHGGAITFGKTWGYGSFDLGDLIDTADVILDLPFVRLGQVIEFKRVANRPKDQAHLDLIEKFLEAEK
ncbi:MAG: hypothetical protein V3S62_01830 [Acidimicrobiia bacterium]